MKRPDVIEVHRASTHELSTVEAVVAEYCDAIGVLVRDERSALETYCNADSGVWLASSLAEVVGCVVMRPLPVRPQACEVKRLYVRDAYRGRHVADALMDALETYAARCGYRIAYLDSKDDLRAALRFYERRGYRPCERYNDNPQATIFMRRVLESAPQ